ncbi:MAG TPA: thermonuclease family protein [Vitreimonas sp.]|uniref:thermonuclease family protein n=1 Tax=Vitreimonas sp. TaxID=3069702 RepID=UPI002D22C123|nr:thermonuclease family protein [Vitreimonas sp.]HYD86767.1 thermonuclease family protein [Vitreimonas sp.]
MGGWDNAPEYGGGLPKWLTAIAIIVTVLMCVGAAWLAYSNAAAQSTTVAGVASVIDGDTIEIHGQRIRLSGFDSPERGARCGEVNVYQRSALALSDFLAQRTVSCTISDTDRYGRGVGRCSVSGVDLGEHMVAQGWARDWPRYSGGAYADEEAAARRDVRGIWGMTCADDLWRSQLLALREAAMSQPPVRIVILMEDGRSSGRWSAGSP